jgi:hypothetical protein
MTQTIEEIIHGIVDSMQIGYVHETVYGANMELDKIVRDAQRKPEESKLPAAINILATSGRFDVADGAYHDLIREAQNIRILFVDKMKFDDKLDADDTATIEALKTHAKHFIKGVRACSRFSYVTSYNWQVRLNAFDANLAVLELTATLRQEEGVCVYG